MKRSRPALHERRSKGEETNVAAYFAGSKRFFDPAENRHVVKIFAGDWYVSAPGEAVMISTILGSCVAACIRDPQAGIGGMNHFLLPGGESVDPRDSDAARYGVFAMERMINAILSGGGMKQRLEVKIFGGGNVTGNSARIGTKNAQFIRNFLRTEGYAVASEDLEGELPRRVHYYPENGRVMMRRLQRREDRVVIEDEAQYQRTISIRPTEGEVELFS